MFRVFVLVSNVAMSRTGTFTSMSTHFFLGNSGSVNLMIKKVSHPLIDSVIDYLHLRFCGCCGRSGCKIPMTILP